MYLNISIGTSNKNVCICKVLSAYQSRAKHLSSLSRKVLDSEYIVIIREAAETAPDSQHVER